MKKLVFAALIVMLALTIITCDSFTNIVASDSNENGTSIEYLTDNSGKLTGLKLYLDGSAPSNASRTLSQQWAAFGMERFEVVFMASATSNARASWVIGETVSIKDVPGTDHPDGYNYASVSASGPFAAPTGGSAGTGAAVLYAGRNDGTLLAVGRITAVNGATSTIINSSSKTVTFGLAALTGDVSKFVLTGIPTTDHGIIKAKYESYPEFDALAILPDPAATPTPVTATYTIDSAASTFPFTDIFSSFVLGTSSAGFSAPRYELPSGSYAELSGAAIESEVTLITQLTASGAIVFTIERGDKQGLGMFTFITPVTALTTTNGVNGIAPFEWKIRPGYKHIFIDDGGPGGSILFYIKDPLPTALNLNELLILHTGP